MFIIVSVRFCRKFVRNCRKEGAKTPSVNPFSLLPRQGRRGLVSAGRAAFLLALIAATGCQSDTGPAPDPFTGDPWTLSGPEIRIGSVDDPEYVFGMVAGLAPGPGGSLYSLHWREGSIRRWSAEGTPSGSVGRQGEGPGEFQQPTELGFFGDSLWVWDWDGYHVSYFDPEGTFLGRVSPKVDIGGPEGSPPRPSRIFRDGTFLGIEPAWSHEIATSTTSSGTGS